MAEDAVLAFIAMFKKLDDGTVQVDRGVRIVR